MTIDAIGLGLCTVDMLFVVDRQPSFDTTMRASQYLRQGGGPVPTSLVALARLGASTSYVGKVGDDPDGDFIRAELEKEGVDTSSFVVVPGALTRVALVLVEEATGERGFTTRPETCADLHPAEFDRETCKWRHLIENLFGRLKEYRGIAMRCCKTDESFSAFIALAATVIRLR